MKRILVITYYWPPAGGVAVQRTLKFCKYLREFGWNPAVLTVKDGNFEYEDPTLYEEIGDLDPATRARSIEPHVIYHSLKRISGSWKAVTGSGHAGHSGKETRDTNGRLGEWLHFNLFIPDTRIGWMPFAIREGRKLIRTLNPSVIYSSAPPFTAHCVARSLAREFSLPWIADFRDPWLENHVYNTIKRTKFAMEANRRLEAVCLRDADSVITVGPHLAGLLGSKLPEEDRGKIKVIPNGFDTEPVSSPPRSESFLVSYFGTLYNQGYSDTLFRSMGELCKGDEGFRDDLLFRLFGTVSDASRARIQAMLPAANCSIQEPVPQQRLVELLAEGQILTLIIGRVPNNELIVLGKTFDYLPTGHPILGVGPIDGDAAAVLKETGRGHMFDYGDGDGLKAAISELYCRWRAGTPLQTPGDIERFQRRRQAEELAAIFRRTVQSKLR